MKLGPIYLLRTMNWLRLMQEIARADAELRRTETEIGEANAEIGRLREEIEELKKKVSPLVAVPRVKPDPDFQAAPTPKPSRLAMIEALDGWTTRYTVDGQTVGGPLPVYEDELLRRQLEVVGGVAGKRVLELGPMEGAHTRVLCEQGAAEVVAEGVSECPVVQLPDAATRGAEAD